MRTILKLLARRYPPPTRQVPSPERSGERVDEAVPPPSDERMESEGAEQWLDAYRRALWQEALLAWFRLHAETWQVRALPYLSVTVAPGRTRKPAITILRRAPVSQTARADVPLALFEIPPASESIDYLQQRLQGYAVHGVAQIWVIRPESGAFYRLDQGILVPATHFGKAGTAMYFALDTVAALIS